MEVGAVKQAFNNELILLKKKLNQAKIQIIHKLTRKAKTFVEKKAPEKIKEKFNRKAEAAVKEVLIIKKIKPKDLARFIVTHKGDLQSYLNKPIVDQDKACARLLLHKSLHDKYGFIKDRFSSVPIEDLLMSREERKKLKKEAQEKQKNKKKGKADNKVVNAEGEWNVEDVEMPAVKSKDSDNELSSDGKHISGDEESSDGDINHHEASENDSDGLENTDINEPGPELDNDNDISMCNEAEVSESDENNENDEEKEPNEVGKFVKYTPLKIIEKPQILSPKVDDVPFEFKMNCKVSQKTEKKTKDKNKQDKNKNLNNKLLSRTFKKDVSETPVQDTKVVDSFFITSTGENYMSIAEPRQPDEVKEEHKQGNRKLRRAVMFGHVPTIKPRRDNSKSEHRFNRNNNSYSKNDSYKKFNDSNEHFNDKGNFTDKKHNFDRNSADAKPVKEEKLHPSWEAKKKQSGILPYQGKKIVFDES